MPEASRGLHVTIRLMRPTLIDDRYAMLDALGRGGMARVYLARDEVLGQEAALKVLREQYAEDEEFVERFRREAKNAAALNHPSIVQVYDQGRAEDGTYYMAMEYVPGGTLKERILREGPLDPYEAAGVALRIGEALDAAHGRGIVHRDVKPQNVLLTAAGGAKVADFGIARAASSKTMTETNLVLGTAAYMSPEQAMGEPATPKSDLYSLGVVLYEMLTGELPYTAESPVAVCMKHINEPLRPPKEVDSRIPEGMNALVVKLLAKEPEDRYASAAALAEDLRLVRDGLAPLDAGLEEQTTVPTSSMAEATGKTRTVPTVAASRRGPSEPASRLNLLPLLAALLVGAALIGGVAWTLLQGAPDQVASGAGGYERVEVPEAGSLAQEIPTEASPPGDQEADKQAKEGEKRPEHAAGEPKKELKEKQKKEQKEVKRPRAFFSLPFGGGDLAELLPGVKGRKEK
jgi:eukaryotic-like serine/threonine-protein kinase